MGLMAMLEEVLNGQAATAIVATPATHKPKTPPTVAAVAGVAVARSQKPKAGKANLRLVHTGPEPTEKEAVLYAERLYLFQSKGIADDAASTLASRLIERDRQLDDRRSCGECAAYYTGRCKRGLYPIGESTIQTLHRCKGFTV